MPGIVTASPSDRAPSDVPSEGASEATSDMFSNELPVGSAKNASCLWIDFLRVGVGGGCMSASSAGKYSITGDDGMGGGDWMGGDGIVGESVTLIPQSGNVASSSHSLEEVSLTANPGANLSGGSGGGFSGGCNFAYSSKHAQCTQAMPFELLDRLLWKRLGGGTSSRAPESPESTLFDRCSNWGTLSKSWHCCCCWRFASSWISSKEAERTCLGTSRLLWVFISAPVGVLDRLKVVRSRCITAHGPDEPGLIL